MDRKRTAWKKSRKFGDVWGGRKWPKMADRVFRRVHNLEVPGADQDTPILIEENPSRDFFFPLSGEEALEELRKLPQEHTEGLTHLWLPRIRKLDYEKGEFPLAVYAVGGGVQLVLLYPWPRDMRLVFGKKKPTASTLKMYAPYSSQLENKKGSWFLQFHRKALRDLYIELLLYHEIGHHIDYYNRRWSKANRKNLAA